VHVTVKPGMGKLNILKRVTEKAVSGKCNKEDEVINWC
jgi:hypothetical protein